MDEIWITKGWFVQRLLTGRGVIVVRPGYVAFLPTEEIKHLGATIAKGVIMSAAGLVEIDRRKPVPVDKWLGELKGSDPEQFDQQLEPLIEATGGLKWLPTNATVRIRRIPLRRKKRLWFMFGEQSIRLSSALGKDELQYAETLLHDWPRS